MNIECKICSSSTNHRHVIKIRNPGSNESFDILECPNCLVKIINPIPADLSLIYQSNPYNQTSHWLFRELKKILINFEIKRLEKYTQCAHFLDIGSGAGEFSLMLHKKGYKIFSCDAFNERPVLIKNIADIAYCRYNYDDYMPDQNPSMGKHTAIIRHVLEHIKRPKLFLGNLIKGGARYFYIVVPNAGCLEYKIFKTQPGLWFAPHHIWHFQKQSLTQLFEKLNIDVIQSGFDTIPMGLHHLCEYSTRHQWPSVIQKFLKPTSLKLALSCPLNFILPNNVLWMIGKVK